LPVTERERWLWVGVALTAAVCEEVLFRGFLTLYIGHYLPSLHPALIAVLAGIAFGLAHTYQGLKGVLATGVMGIFLGLVYWLTKSLIPGIVFHAFVNLRVLLVWRGTVETEATVS
jgi:membrane protease YdiL (CAAX protease family)